MNGDDSVKRGRGRGRGARARGKGRGRGRGRGRKPTRVVSSDEEISQDVADEVLDKSAEDFADAVEPPQTAAPPPPPPTAMVVDEEVDKESVPEPVAAAVPAVAVVEETVVVPPTIDMEADISQLEAPTFTTISRGPPEPMLRLKWDHKVSLIGEKVLNPMIHCCDQCDKPILVYGRMIPCKHVFCLKCARAEPVKICPRCKDKVVRVEQSGLGTVFMCTHEGSRYGNTGCRRTYLSQRDLQAHINHRHVTISLTSVPEPKVPVIPEAKVTSQRKISESSTSAPPAIQAPLSNRQVPKCPPPPSLLTQANLNRVNAANAANAEAAGQQQSKGQSHHHESVADASYYSSVLNSYANSASQSYSSPTVQLINQNYGSMPSISQQPGNSPGVVPLMNQPPPPPAPPQAMPGFFPYGQQFGQMIPPPNYHSQYDQNNFQNNPSNNPPQWNQQQYYR